MRTVFILRGRWITLYQSWSTPGTSGLEGDAKESERPLVWREAADRRGPTNGGGREGRTTMPIGTESGTQHEPMEIQRAGIRYLLISPYIVLHKLRVNPSDRT